MENVGNNVLQKKDNLATSGRKSRLAVPSAEGAVNFSKIFDSIMTASQVKKDSKPEKAVNVSQKPVQRANTKTKDNSCSHENNRILEDELSDSKKHADMEKGIKSDTVPADEFLLSSDYDKTDSSKENASLEPIIENEVLTDRESYVFACDKPVQNIFSQRENTLSDTESKFFANAEQTAAADLNAESIEEAAQTFAEIAEQSEESLNTEEFSEAVKTLLNTDRNVKNVFSQEVSADFDTKVFEDFARENTADIRQETVTVKSQLLHQVSNNHESVLKGLMQEANVTDIKITSVSSETVNVHDDFGASDFSVIEDSIRASIMMEKSLNSQETAKAKIDAIMDAKAEANQENLNKSLELLRGSSTNQKTVLENMLANERNTLGSSAGEAVLNQSIDKRMASDRGLTGTDSDVFKVQGKGAGSVLSAKTQSGSSNSFDQSQSNQNFSSGLLNQEKAVSKQMAKQFNLLNMSSNLRANAEAIAQKVMMMASRNLKRMELNLNPEGLGKLKISLDIGSQENLNKVTFQASSEATRDLIEKSLATLKNILMSSDIDADVEVGDYLDEKGGQGQFSENEHNQNSSEDNSKEQEKTQKLFAFDDLETVSFEQMQNIAS